MSNNHSTTAQADEVRTLMRAYVRDYERMNGRQPSAGEKKQQREEYEQAVARHAGTTPPAKQKRKPARQSEVVEHDPVDDERETRVVVRLSEHPEPPEWAHEFLSPAQLEKCVPITAWQLLVRRMPKEVLAPRAKAVPAALVPSCLAEPYECVMSERLLAEHMSLSDRNAARRAITELADARFLFVTPGKPGAPGSGGTPNRYALAWPTTKPHGLL